MLFRSKKNISDIILIFYSDSRSSDETRLDAIIYLFFFFVFSICYCLCKCCCNEDDTNQQGYRNTISPLVRPLNEPVEQPRTIIKDTNIPSNSNIMDRYLNSVNNNSEVPKTISTFQNPYEHNL